MNPLRKKLLYSMAVLPLGAWFGLTMTAGAITWYHGYALYFLYSIALLIIIFTPLVVYNPRYLPFFGLVLFIHCFIFDSYAMLLLFFPRWNGWGNWNIDDHWNTLYFLVPPDFSYWTLGFFFLLLAVFGGKKFFELDFDAMKKYVYKENAEMRRDHTYTIGKHNSFSVYFKPKYLIKLEHYLHSAGFILLCIFILPMQHLGSSMARLGNDPVVALFFFIVNYFFLCLCFYVLICGYARVKVFQQIEKELGVKLQPIVRIKLKR